MKKPLQLRELRSVLPGTPGMTGIDTNVLLRAFVDEGDPQTSAATELLQNLSQERPGFIAQGTLVEFYWTLRNRYRIPKEDCLLHIRRLVMSPHIEFDDTEGVARALAFAERGADFADALIHTTFEQFQCDDVVTFDRRAAVRLGWRLLASEKVA